MKILLIFFIGILLTACGPEAEPLEAVTYKDEYGYTEKYSVKRFERTKEGLYQKTDEQGRLIEEANYRNDSLHGLRVLYFEDGDTMSVEHYEKGLFEGWFRSYYENGQLEVEGLYENNVMTGLWNRYYPDGQLMEEVTFKNNSENGPFKEYHSNGKLKAVGGYLDGDNEHGELKLYDENGTLLRTMMCNYGRCKTVE